MFAIKHAQLKVCIEEIDIILGGVHKFCHFSPILK